MFEKCISTPSNFLPLSHSVPVLGQFEQLREHWRSFFHVTLTLNKVMRRMIAITIKMIMKANRMMVCSSNSVISLAEFSPFSSAPPLMSMMANRIAKGNLC